MVLTTIKMNLPTSINVGKIVSHRHVKGPSSTRHLDSCQADKPSQTWRGNLPQLFGIDLQSCEPVNSFPSLYLFFFNLFFYAELHLFWIASNFLKQSHLYPKSLICSLGLLASHPFSIFTKFLTGKPGGIHFPGFSVVVWGQRNKDGNNTYHFYLETWLSINSQSLPHSFVFVHLHA